MSENKKIVEGIDYNLDGSRKQQESTVSKRCDLCKHFNHKPHEVVIFGKFKDSIIMYCKSKKKQIDGTIITALDCSDFDVNDKEYEAIVSETFIKNMNKRLEMASSCKGDSWKHTDFDWLRSRMFHTVGAWFYKHRHTHKKEDIKKEKKELIDIANFCYFLFSKLEEFKDD